MGRVGSVGQITIICSKIASSNGMAIGPIFANPYSSSTWANSLLNTGWFKYVAFTKNRLQLEPTFTATWAVGTSDGVHSTAVAAFFCHRRSIRRSQTMRRISSLIKLLWILSMLSHQIYMSSNIYIIANFMSNYICCQT